MAIIGRLLNLVRRRVRLVSVMLVVIAVCLLFYSKLWSGLKSQRSFRDTDLDAVLSGQHRIEHRVGVKGHLSDLVLYQPYIPIFMRSSYSKDTLYPIKIPKIIHQIWDTHRVPRAFHKWMKSWKEVNPSFQHWFWTLEEARNLIRKHYPSFLTLYDSYLTPVFRADAARYFIIHHHGGFYFDLDCTALQALDPWAEAYECLVSEEPWEHSFVIREQQESNILNGFIACKARHPFLKLAIDNLKEAAGKYYGDVLKATGPHFFNYVFNKYQQALKTKPKPHMLPLMHQQRHDHQLRLKQENEKFNEKVSSNKSPNEKSPSNKSPSNKSPNNKSPSNKSPNDKSTNDKSEKSSSLPSNSKHSPLDSGVYHPLNAFAVPSSQLATLTKLPSKYFFPTYDRSEGDTLVHKCSPYNFKSLPTKIAQALCHALIRKGFKQQSPVGVTKKRNDDIKIKGDFKKGGGDVTKNDEFVDAYADHDWLHSYLFHQSWKLKDTANITDVIPHVILPTNRFAASDDTG